MQSSSNPSPTGNLASGKTTLLKQMRIAYAASLVTFSEKEDARDLLVDSTLTALRSSVVTNYYKKLLDRRLAQATRTEGAEISEFLNSANPWTVNISEIIQALRRNGHDFQFHETIK